VDGNLCEGSGQAEDGQQAEQRDRKMGAEDIQMGPISYLTAVDTSLTHDLSPIDRDTIA
jgi:hypothetical protein